MVEGRMITLDLITESFPSSVPGTHLLSVHQSYHSPLSESSNETDFRFLICSCHTSLSIWIVLPYCTGLLSFLDFLSSLSQCQVLPTFPIFSVKSILSSFKSFLWVLYKSFLYKLKAWSRKQLRQSVFTGTNPDFYRGY